MIGVVAIVLIAAVSGYLWFADPNLSGAMAVIAPLLLVVVVVTMLLLARQAGRWRREYSLDDDQPGDRSGDRAHGRRSSGIGMARGRAVYFRR